MNTRADILRPYHWFPGPAVCPPHAALRHQRLTVLRGDAARPHVYTPITLLRKSSRVKPVTMIQVVVLTLVATSSAFTTHRYDAYDNYRPITTLFSDIFTYGAGDARRLMQAYDNPRRHNEVRVEHNQRPGGGRLDTQYNYWNPHEWSNREVPWSAVVTEPANIVHRFKPVNRDDATMVPSTEREPAEQEDPGADINQTNGTDDINRTQVVINKPQLNIQSGDANRTVINEQQITWNNEHNRPLQDNANITTRSINSNSNYSNSLHFKDVPSKPSLDNQNNSTKTNDEVASRSGAAQHNVTDEERSNNTQRSDVSTTNDVDDDRWIWSNGEDPKVETVTVGLDDRAAFDGVACPVGKVKVGTMCITPD